MEGREKTKGLGHFGKKCLHGIRNSWKNDFGEAMGPLSLILCVPVLGKLQIH